METPDMNTDDLTIKRARELAAMFCGTPVAATVPKSDERPVIVRSRDAGVQFGYLLGYEGSTVHLRDARQMWSWTAAEGGTLLDCATHGVKAGKFSTSASRVTVIGACAIIDCTEKAVKTLESAKWG
jgi:hypothetical protein